MHIVRSLSGQTRGDARGGHRAGRRAHGRRGRLSDRDPRCGHDPYARRCREGREAAERSAARRRSPAVCPGRVPIRPRPPRRAPPPPPRCGRRAPGACPPWRLVAIAVSPAAVNGPHDPAKFLSVTRTRPPGARRPTRQARRWRSSRHRSTSSIGPGQADRWSLSNSTEPLSATASPGAPGPGRLTLPGHDRPQSQPLDPNGTPTTTVAPRRPRRPGSPHAPHDPGTDGDAGQHRHPRTDPGTDS